MAQPDLVRPQTAEAIGTFAPTLASGQRHDFWRSVLGPLAGAPLRALAYQFVRGERSVGRGPRRRG